MTDEQTVISGPPMPERLAARYEVSPELMRVQFRPRSWVMVIVIAGFLTAWTAGCAMMTVGVINNPQLFQILFGIPFWSSWLFLVWFLFALVFRRQDVELDSESLRYTDRVFLPLSHREVPRGELRCATVDRHVSKNEESEKVEWGIAVTTLGKPLIMLRGLPEDEASWLTFQINRFLNAETATIDSVAAPIAAAVPETPVALVPSAAPVEPPSDNRWALCDDGDAVEFINRGQWSWAAVLGLLFIGIFWNGIVSVFVANLWGLGVGVPAGGEWWFLFFFLIPFEAIGLLLLAGLLLAVLEPARRTRWRFELYDIERNVNWFGLGWRRRYAVEGLQHLRLARPDKSRFRASQASTSEAEQPGYTLELIRADNTRLCRTDPLTEGEARWMGDQILRARPRWFEN